MLGSYVEIVAHLEECDYKTVSCPNTGCSVTIFNLNLKNHIEACDFSEMPCPDCCLNFKVSALKFHQINCQKSIVKCPRNCGITLKKQTLIDHLKEDCSVKERSCPFVKFGCSDILFDEKGLQQHCLDNIVSHMHIVASQLEHCSKQLLEKKRNRSVATRVDNISYLRQMYGSEKKIILNFETEFSNPALSLVPKTDEQSHFSTVLSDESIKIQGDLTEAVANQSGIAVGNIVSGNEGFMWDYKVIKGKKNVLMGIIKDMTSYRRLTEEEIKQNAYFLTSEGTVWNGSDYVWFFPDYYHNLEIHFEFGNMENSAFLKILKGGYSEVIKVEKQMYRPFVFFKGSKGTIRILKVCVPVESKESSHFGA